MPEIRTVRRQQLVCGFKTDAYHVKCGLCPGWAVNT